MEIESALLKRIGDNLEKLNGLEMDSEEYKATVNELNCFIDRAIEMEKIHVESEKNQNEMAEEKKNRLIQNVFTGINVVGGVLLVIWGTNKTLKFEETGTVTTTAGKKFANRIFSFMR